jgi:tudor domain-containing protein 3
MINYLDIQKQLQLNGWFLKKSEIETLYKDHDNLDVKKIIQLCLNIDLRDIQELDVKGKLDSLNSDVVLQIQKIRNVGAPKDNPESKTAPRLFKLQLTDGNSTYSAIEAETIQAFTMNTAPGTKILLKLKSSTIETANGQLLLKPSNCTVLGGHVSHLVEKWELTRSLAKYAKGARIGGVNGPPPFYCFW